MSTQFKDVFGALAAPIPRDQIRVRQQRGDRIAYITARVAQNRLDEVIGPENWEYDWRIVGEVPKGNTTIVLADARVKIRIGERVIARRDTGGAANPDPIVARKGAVSDAFKRACALFGIARELYGDGVAEYEADELASIEPPPAAVPPPQQPARTRPSERKRGPLPAADLARLVDDEAFREFEGWTKEFLADEALHLQDLASEAESGAPPEGWKLPLNEFRLVNHFFAWLQGRGTVEKAAAKNGTKARCVAWAWSKHRDAFVQELSAWRDKLIAEATAHLAAAAEPGSSQAGEPGEVA